nr:MAG TPA: structural protein [Caudoviricetes sp.]
MDAFNVYTSRFLEVIDSLKISDYQVWNNLESLSKGTMSKIRCGRVGVSMNVLYEFCNKYNVNANYILTGEGEMLKSEPASSDSESKTNKTSAPYQIETKNINIDLHGEQIDSKRTIEVLIKVIETYQTRMDDLLNVIEVLKNENTDLKEQLEKPNVS